MNEIGRTTRKNKRDRPSETIVAVSGGAMAWMPSTGPAVPKADDLDQLVPAASWT
jgi:hypothetical protein